jgi:hypothetical protein
MYTTHFDVFSIHRLTHTHDSFHPDMIAMLGVLSLRVGIHVKDISTSTPRNRSTS